MRTWSGLVSAVVSVALVAACSSGDDDGAAEDSVELGSADETIDGSERDNAVVGVIGEPVTLDDGAVVTIDSIVIDPEFDDGRWEPTHVIDLRVENPTGEDLMAPGPEMFCAGDDQGGAWYEQSTYEPFSELPSGSVREGVLYLSLHTDDGFPRDDCVDPVVRVERGGGLVPVDRMQVEYPAPPLPE